MLLCALQFINITDEQLEAEGMATGAINKFRMGIVSLKWVQSHLLDFILIAYRHFVRTTHV